ncbi:DNA polymerase III subunit beta [Deinococcus soli (ex Cha et al. 2016)]|uniref:DNA polymerase-3 subunit beta n=2 Tax=Deinococcus soli (ex Cha et al. 2016) TaxID=1309411 RepID=A0ACC6KFJ9_9DEIO|nr:DNA polymerase III subunit beta [Deinococcus soli (ex Cha et al. 2016)]MDR6218211.1 DNA polymerase-3 subunit beta [Deinococcus soli (ex Cha et al. 2016)]MDR6328951.1 DNA polymerase-3 subunit beta [Deinococcus soli (ex Cha et al. 2016)]MDR6751224.1 DNA polymerase-3 subunit beta [Deinococcus soli (ex Cha et al. 2016)]
MTTLTAPATTKINSTKKALVEKLSILERIIPSRNSNPLLTALKVEARAYNSTLVLAGTSLEIDMEASLSAEVQRDASFIVPMHLFAQIIKNLSGDLLTLTLEGTEVVIAAGGSDFRIQTGDLNAYPPLHFAERSDERVSAAQFRQALTSVRYAASNEAFQAVFRGLKFEQSAGRGRMVASDGYRVIIQEFSAGQDERNVLIPARSADEVIRALSKEDQIGLTYGDALLTITGKDIRMNVKLLDGDFPDYERVIPKAVTTTVTGSTVVFREAVNRVAVLSDKNANNRIELLIRDQRVTLTAEGDYGRAVDTFETSSKTGEDVAIAFNAAFLAESLAHIDGDFTMDISGSTLPGILRNAARTHMAVIVPLRV